MAAEVALALPVGTAAEVKAGVVLAATAMTSLVTGLALYLIGRYRFGNLFRFIPYPVVGGFLAGSGWLLATGAFRVMLGAPVHFHEIGNLFHAGQPTRWLPGILFGAVLFAAMRKFRRPLILPGMLFGSIVLFYLSMALSGSSLAELRQAGWLPQPPAEGGFQLQLWSAGALDSLSGSALMKTAEQSSLVSVYLVGFQLPLSGAVLALPEWLGKVTRPLISSYWGWSGYLQTLQDTRFYNAVVSMTQTPLMSVSAVVWVLGFQILLGLTMAYVGVRGSRWE
jgi:SulP family sulfate permease